MKLSAGRPTEKKRVIQPKADERELKGVITNAYGKQLEAYQKVLDWYSQEWLITICDSGDDRIYGQQRATEERDFFNGTRSSQRQLLEAQKRYVINAEQKLASGKTSESDRDYLTKKIKNKKESILRLEESLHTLEERVNKMGGPIKQFPWLDRKPASRNHKRKMTKRKNTY